MLKELTEKLETISAINLVPFKENENIDWEGLEENIEFLMENGVKVIVPGGNTGEFYHLSIDEYKRVLKKVIEIVDGRAVIMAGIGYSIPIAIELGEYAKAVGADCVMIHQPIHPYINSEGFYEYLKEIITTLELPSIVYFKDPNLDDVVLKRLAPLEKFIAVKYAINDMARFRKTVHDVPKEHNILWICGTAEKWAPFYYHAGARGFTSGLVNIQPKKSFDLLNNLQENNLDEVWEIWRDVLQFEELRLKHNNGNNVIVIKEALNQAGLNAGITRPPVSTLNAEDKEEITEILKSWGMLNY